MACHNKHGFSHLGAFDTSWGPITRAQAKIMKDAHPRKSRLESLELGLERLQ